MTKGINNHDVTLDRIDNLFYQNFQNIIAINLSWQEKILHQVSWRKNIYAVTFDWFNYLLYKNFQNRKSNEFEWKSRDFTLGIEMFFTNKHTDQNTVQLQFLHNLHLTLLLVQPLLPVLEYPGKYQLKILQME